MTASKSHVAHANGSLTRRSVASHVDQISNGLVGALLEGESFELDGPLVLGVVAHYVLSIRLSSVTAKSGFRNQSAVGVAVVAVLAFLSNVNGFVTKGFPLAVSTGNGVSVDLDVSLIPSASEVREVTHGALVFAVTMVDRNTDFSDSV